MKLKQIYKSDIDRDINGVIKVAQDDDASVAQELREYIITRELRSHFNTFFGNYEKSLSSPTDKIGVWISGFFGSGKSHFLKMLSYILSNKVVAGKHAVDYFADKFDDPMMFALIERCVAVPTDTILFNIDAKSPTEKDKTAILKVFTKVFYEHIGFYGDDLKVAKLEQFVDRQGKTSEFRETFERINGSPWTEARDAFAFFEDDIVQCLVSVLGMSESSARDWFNGTENTEMSIERLVTEIKEYIDGRGKDYRLLFCVDEIGQYIGSDNNLMLNLQTIVEEIGSRCNGRVWVMVTSQEAIDSVTSVRGNDFSKITGRFNTRLSLSSSSVDEVIKKRILAKNDAAAEMLRSDYAKYSAVLKNLFTFSNAAADMKGYSNETEFVETYPFIPYQFRLMQNVLAEIRKHGNSGKHLAAGERSMLSGFQEVAQKIENEDDTALVPFCLFYDTVHTFLESSIRRVIDRCKTAAENNDVLVPFDVDVLKLLYLIRYVDDVKGNVDTVTTLMINNVDCEKITLRAEIRESLDRLISQNYIARNGDIYTFLTDDEQEIAREIRNTTVDSASITQAIAQMIFGSIYESKKFRYNGKYDFPFDRFVDETLIGTPSGAVRLRFVTVASEMYGGGDERFCMQSHGGNEAIVVLSDVYSYFEEIENALKIRKFCKSRNISQLPETIQRIIRSRQQQASEYEKHAEELVSNAIASATFYAAGEKLDIRAGGAKEKTDTALSFLVESVYSKLGLVRNCCESDAEILKILSKEDRAADLFGSDPNAEALAEIDTYLRLQSERALPTSMGDIQRRFQKEPYGWREIDIAALVAALVAEQKISVSYAGNLIQPSDVNFPNYLRRRTEIDKTAVKRRVAVPDNLLRNAKRVIGEYFNVMDIPSDEDRLIGFIIDSFTKQKAELEALLSSEYRENKYPDKKVVERAVELCNAVLLQRRDNVSLLRKIVDSENELLDSSEDMNDVSGFFKNQKPIFDSAFSLVSSLAPESEYLNVDKDAVRIIGEIKSVLKSERPYRRISELPELTSSLAKIYSELLNAKKEEVFAEITAAMGEVHQTAGIDQKEIVHAADEAFEEKKAETSAALSLTELDALKIRIDGVRCGSLKNLIVKTESGEDTVTLNRASICYTATLRTEADIDEYLAEIREKLVENLANHDALHII